MILAAQNGYKEIAELLIEIGANINHQNSDGKTPLIFSASNVHKEIVELLLTKGANVNHKNSAGKMHCFMQHNVSIWKL